jgi:hypothetical protein
MWTAYAPQVIAAVIALFQLAKDWGAHKSTWRRALIAIAIIVLMSLSIANTLRATRRASKQHSEDVQKITQLQASVDSANLQQKENTALFLRQFDSLSGRVAKLQTEAATEQLQKQASALQRELVSTRKLLEPGPKAELVFSLPGEIDQVLKKPQRRGSVTSRGDVVHVDFVVGNPTDVEAGQGYLAITICDSCLYAKEPEGFQHTTNSSLKQRNREFTAFYPKTVVPTMSVDVLIPPKLNRFDIALAYRCQKCEPKPLQVISVAVTRQD